MPACASQVVANHCLRGSLIFSRLNPIVLILQRYVEPRRHDEHDARIPGFVGEIDSIEYGGIPISDDEQDVWVSTAHAGRTREPKTRSSRVASASPAKMLPGSN